MPENQPNGGTDFNAAKIATTVNKHDDEFIAVKSRLDVLEAKFGDNQKIATTFVEVASKQTDMEGVFATVFVKLLAKDEGIKTAVGALINTADRNAVKAFWKKFGFAIWSAALFVLGLLVKVGIDLLTKHAGQ